MEVHINEVLSNVRAVDDAALLAPSTLQTIVSVVLEAVQAQAAHQERVRTEQQVTGSVRVPPPAGRR